MRSASVSTGRAATLTISRPSSARRSTCRRRLWNSPSVVTRRGRSRERQRREPSCHELVGVLSERDVLGAVAEQPCKPGAHAVGLDRGLLPLLVDVFGGIEPGALLRLESDVRPCLMRVAGQQQPLADAEARIVLGERILDQATSLSFCLVARSPQPEPRADLLSVPRRRHDCCGSHSSNTPGRRCGSRMRDCWHGPGADRPDQLRRATTST